MHAWQSPDIPRITEAVPDGIAPLPQEVYVYETSRQKISPITPANGKNAGLYVCGITPYDATHLGHAFTYLTFDLLYRAWLDLGYQVHYVQNVTDVDDPLLERAEATGQDWRELAEQQTKLFFDDMSALRIIAPNDYIAATEAMDEVAEMVTKLDQGGYCYQIDDEQYPDWYFQCTKTPGFGNVSNLAPQLMIDEFAEHGGDPQRLAKKDPLDALLWRQHRIGEPSWKTALGQGRPGWHIECSAIALNRLGTNFTVQGGGQDLAFPHHEMSSAHAVAATGKPFAENYIHSAMVSLDGEKMSKSRGNLELVSRLRNNGWKPAEIRLALLKHHFATNWEWFATDMDEARRRADAWRAAFHAPKATPAAPVIAELRRAIRSNLDAPTALAVIDDWSAATLAGDGDDSQAAGQIAQAVDSLLGVAL